MSSNACQAYVVKAVEYICAMGVHLTTEDVRWLLQECPAVQEAERRVDVAALTGDVTATKTACRAWWEAWRNAIARVPQQTSEKRVA